MRTVAHVTPCDLAGFLPLLGRDQVLEDPRADEVGALADQQRAVGLFGLDQVDAGEESSTGPAGHAAGRLALDYFGDGAQVIGRGSAAAPDQVQPAAGGEAFQLRGQRPRGFQVPTFLVRQAGVD